MSTSSPSKQPIEDTPHPTRGGLRHGAGRKSRFEDVDLQNRALVCRWLCDWFARKLSEQSSKQVTDQDCERSVNESVDVDNPVFKTEKSRQGFMWQKARTGDRPFSPERLAKVAAAAAKLNFWPGLSHQAGNDPGDDLLTFYILKLASVDELRDEKVEKKQFKSLQGKMETRLRRLHESKSAARFNSAKKDCVTALLEWIEFCDALPKAVGEIWIRNDLEASFQSGTNDEFIYYTLKPRLALVWIQSFQFGAVNRHLNRLRWQVWALEFYPGFLNMSQAKRHVHRASKGPSTGTKLSQPARKASKIEQS